MTNAQEAAHKMEQARQQLLAGNITIDEYNRALRAAFKLAGVPMPRGLNAHR